MIGPLPDQLDIVQLKAVDVEDPRLRSVGTEEQEETAIRASGEPVAFIPLRG